MEATVSDMIEKFPENVFQNINKNIFRKISFSQNEEITSLAFG